MRGSAGRAFVQDRGTLYGVYEFLKGLGVRWYRPDPWGEYVPRRRELRLSLGRRVIGPAYRYRWGHNSYRWGWGVGSGDDQTRRQYALGKLCATRNRQNTNLGTGPEYGGYYRVDFSHAYQQLVPHSRYFASHPEYFALIGGTRSQAPDAQLCLSNPAVQELVARAIIRNAKEHPEQEVFSVEPNDFSLWCECDRCRAMDDPKLRTVADDGASVSMANRVTAFNNAVARRVATQAPGVKVGWLAYNMHTEVPTRVHELEPNTMVQAAAFAGGYSDYRKKLRDRSSPQNRSFLQTLEGYGRMTRLMTYEYWSGYAWYGPIPLVHTLVDRLREYRKLNVVGVNTESYPSWGPQGLEIYLCTRLMWNPDLDVRKELEFYYRNYYGPAARPMKAYHELVERASLHGSHYGSGGYGLETLFTSQLVREMGVYLRKARRLVRGDALYARRLEGLGAGYEFVRRMAAFRHLQAGGNRCLPGRLPTR